MLHFCKHILFLLSLGVTYAVPASYAATDYTAPKYNLDSLCYMSTDVVEASLVRHYDAHYSNEDTFTATVLETLGGDYKIGDTIDFPYSQVTLLPNSCSLCILFIARKQFQLDLKNANIIPPQINEVLPVDSLNRVYRYFQWTRLAATLGQGSEDYLVELSYPSLIDECQIIKSRWIAVNQIRPLLSRAFEPEDVPLALSLRRKRQQCLANETGKDIVGDVIHARLADLRDPESHQANAVVFHIIIIAALEHLICVK